jgi:general secretion pathway protein G
MSSRRIRRRGFTLIEVLLVLVILVILASLAVTAYGPVQRRANVNAAKSQIGLFKTPLGLYQNDIGNYPMTEQGLMGLVQPPADAPPGKWNGPYLEGNIPLDPWGRQYNYKYPGDRNPQSYDVWSAGPDGVDGTEDDVGNWSLE